MKIKSLLITLSFLYPFVLTACSSTSFLRYSPESDLHSYEGATWGLSAFGPADHQVPALPEPQITLRFDFEDKVASGSAGCNSYSANFFMRGDQLTIENAMSTLMACIDDQAMLQETEYIRLLTKVTNYKIENTSLILFAETGESLHFTLGN